MAAPAELAGPIVSKLTVNKTKKENNFCGVSVSFISRPALDFGLDFRVDVRKWSGLLDSAEKGQLLRWLRFISHST